MLKDNKKGKFSGKFTLDAKAKIAFKRFKAAFVIVPMLCYFNLTQKIFIKSNALKFAVIVVISPPKARYRPMALHCVLVTKDDHGQKKLRCERS